MLPIRVLCEQLQGRMCQRQEPTLNYLAIENFHHWSSLYRAFELL